METSSTESPHLPRALLILISHAHSPPLQPPPHLKYDLRGVPNPPKAIRDAYTGVSKRLRDHMLGHNAFVELLERADFEIRKAMQKEVETWSLESNTSGDNEANEDEDGSIPKAKDMHEVGVCTSRVNNENFEGSTTEGRQSYEEEVDSCPLLTVGAFCARGHHRSVAFIEELSRREWTRQWDIRVIHRDIGRERGGGKKNSRGTRPVRGADMFNEH